MSPELGSSDRHETVDDPPVLEITIVHGSLGCADYPLMIGGFADQLFSGQERFVDRQFDGLLGSWVEVGLFPTEVGTSRFVEPNPDAETEPPGCYVIGLGSLVDLQREQLTFSVRQALVDRCIRLYRDSQSAGGDGGVIEVGVSSALMGVSSDRGLRVEDSIAGIVEGVLQANLALAHYEASPAGGGRTVRVTALQFIERLAEQANLGAVALRSLSSAVHLPSAYDALRSVIVEERPGGLPLGATLTEVAQSWRRFVITAVENDDRPPADPRRSVDDADDRCLNFDISLLGREARADRVRHRLDKVMVDALVDRLVLDTGDQRIAGTLYDQLVPLDLRTQFQTTSAIQFVVDATTAKYPWELLGAPRPSGGRSAGGTFGGVIRQFTESEHRRVNPDRAISGRSLVIAVGKVPGENELPSVYAECDLVGRLLDATSPGRVTVLDDRRGELDLVNLQNELFGDHQLVHIASHGVYEEDRPTDTGAVLARGALLTVDTIRQLTSVPDVVFLNCCSLGRIGQNRMAAGLAREFMAIGVRALVAAAWPIDDAAARVFAETFYRELVGGRPLGDTITRARNVCAEVGGRETWAAYQCYGDPGFVLRGSRVSLGEAVTEPVSETDLIARLDGLAVRVSDLGRPGRGGVVDRRKRLLATWNQLAGWIDGRPHLAASAPIQRRLASTARDLGEYRIAAARFRQFVVGDSDGSSVVGPQTNSASVADVQQAANCLARAGQLAARQADIENASDRKLMALGELALAADLARAAADLLPNRESLGILASALKRAATVDLPHRDGLLKEALDTYRQANTITTGDRFGAENAVQLAIIVGGEYADWASAQLAAGSDPAPVPDGAFEEGRPRVDRRRVRIGDFWWRADVGDRALSRLVAANDDAARHAAADEMIAAYQRAFASRSTWSERQSAIDHLRDLNDLLPHPDARRPHLQRALAELRRWEELNVERGVPPPAAVAPAVAATGAVAGIHTVASGVSVTAFPAGCGDCLLVEWDGPTGHHRLLIDGGMANVLDDGLGRFAAAKPEGRLHVDVAVVTHIDLDHIGGAISAFRRGFVEAADVWFNGLDEIRSVRRGPRQGDEFSSLIPADRRNRPVTGGAIHVADDGPLPAFDLADGARCTVFGPTLERLEHLERAWTSSRRGSSDESIEELAERIGSDLDRGAARSFGGDSSVANGSSIAMLFEYAGTSLLLTGDAFAGDLERSIRRLLAERDLTRLKVQLFKLAHHGSMGNVTPELLDLIDPGVILICTDGTRFGHPDRETIDLLRQHYATPPIQFTDDTPIVRERAALAGSVPPAQSPVNLRF
ncbi:MAG TPA: CHAT domain-containing protein [Ilumatobacteraceae bacterium]|nr:CHAT domain-containing protein [Ilumatobacteraceae bacterium]